MAYNSLRSTGSGSTAVNHKVTAVSSDATRNTHRRGWVRNVRQVAAYTNAPAETSNTTDTDREIVSGICDANAGHINEQMTKPA